MKIVMCPHLLLSMKSGMRGQENIILSWFTGLYFRHWTLRSPRQGVTSPIIVFPVMSTQQLYHFSRAAVTKHHNGVTGITEMYCLRILEARHLRSRCPQSWFLLRAGRKSLIQASLLAAGVGRTSLAFLGCSGITLHSALTGSSCVHICVQISPFV